MARGPGRPKKERPADPLAHVREENTDFLPPLMGSGARNAPEPAAEELATAIKRIQRLDQEIRELNRAKADVYAELRSKGFGIEHVKRAIKELRLDPIARAKRESLFATYWEQLTAALDASDGDGE